MWALQSNRPLSDDERRKISILLHTATGSWEWDKLAAWSAADLQEWGMSKDILTTWQNDVSNLSNMLISESEVEFKEYDETIADGINVCKCPTCGHEHAAKKD